MAKDKEYIKYDVLSVRVTAAEKRIIKKLAIRNKMNITRTVHDLIFGSGLIVNADQP
jgi:hypothetical protein